MKTILLLLIVIWSTIALGQTTTNKTSGLIVNSNNGLESYTNLKVVYVHKESQINKPAFF